MEYQNVLQSFLCHRINGVNLKMDAASSETLFDRKTLDMSNTFVIVIVIIIVVVVVIIIVASIIIIILDIAQNFKKSYQTQQCAEILWANQECHIQKIFFV